MSEVTIFPILSLFSGGGFLDLGFMNQGFQIEKALEINEKFIEGYNYGLSNYTLNSNNIFLSTKLVKHNNINEAVDLSDIKKHKEIKSQINKVSGIIGGPPCQDYSVGGTNKGIEGERGKLILNYLSFIKMIKPEFLLFENVQGLYRTKKHKKSFEILIEELEGLGYILWYDIINPINYGLPQDRPRIIVVGFKRKIISKLLKNGYLCEKNNTILKSTISEQYIFRWPKILFEKPKSQNWPKKWEFGSNQTDYDLSELPEEYTSLQVINAFKGLNDMIPNQTELFKPKSDKFLKIAEGDTNRKSFKRLHRFRYSPTVAYGNNEVHLHPTESRRLTVREALRIQTVPDEYILPKEMTLTSKFKLISNGVPPSQASLIASEIRRTLMIYKNLE